MPPAKKANKKRSYPKRKAGIPRSVNPRYQTATVVETLDPQYSFLDNVAVHQSLNLQAFPRCVAMARLYEQFRIEEVKYVYTPFFNTFQESGALSPSAPVFYHVKDRLASLTAATTGLSDLTQMGAIRQKFTKPITVKYRPNTMITTGVAQPGAPGQTLQINGVDYGRWFPCVTQTIGVAYQNTPNTLSALSQIYQGHWIYVEQVLNAAGASASVAITVRVSFKNPMINQPSSVVDTVVPLTFAHGPVETRTQTVIGQD